MLSSKMADQELWFWYHTIFLNFVEFIVYYLVLVASKLLRKKMVRIEKKRRLGILVLVL